jgi:FkbM family methyltransferase
VIFKVPVLNKTGWENLFLGGGWFTEVLMHLNAIKNWTIIDIGANIGQTLLKVKSIDKEINYVGFEPNPACVHYLYQLIAKNHLSKTILCPAGISSKTELLTFYYYSESETDPAASIIPHYRPESSLKKTKIVPVFNINEVSQIKELSKINLIKIDVEGAELEVLLSCEEIIRKHKPFIIIEILPVYTSDNVIRRERQEKIEDLITRLDYKIFLIKKGKYECFDKLEDKDTIGIHNNILNIDYLLTPINVEAGEITG